MLKKKIGIVSISFALALAAPASANSPDNTAQAVISSINARDLGFDFYISGTTNPMNCSRPELFRISNSMSNRDAMVSLLITAFTTQRSVSVYAYSCDSDGASLVAGVRVY